MNGQERYDGGSAFPIVETYERFSDDGAVSLGVRSDVVDSGMTLRDYFAAHAPGLIPDWFEPTVTAKPEPIYHEGHSTEKDSCFECLPENWRERDRWTAEYQKQTFIQWPYAWADLMLAEREK